MSLKLCTEFQRLNDTAPSFHSSVAVFHWRPHPFVQAHDMPVISTHGNGNVSLPPGEANRKAFCMQEAEHAGSAAGRHPRPDGAAVDGGSRLQTKKARSAAAQVPHCHWASRVVSVSTAVRRSQLSMLPGVPGGGSSRQPVDATSERLTRVIKSRPQYCHAAAGKHHLIVLLSHEP